MRPLKTTILLWGLVLMVTACRSASSVDFYTLNARMDTAVSLRESDHLNPVSVGIGSVDLPEYLDRPQIVTLKGPHRLHLSEFHRWAGRLDREIAQVTAQNLSAALRTTKVFIFPWNESEDPDFKVEIKFYHLEGVLGKSLHIQGVWSLTGKALDGHPQDYSFDQQILISGPDYEDMVAACSRGLWDLGQKISQRIAAKTTMSIHK